MGRVGILLNSAWHGYNFRLNLARHICQAGYEVVFLLPKDGHYSNKIEKDFQVLHLDMKANKSNLISDLRLLLDLYKNLKVIKPDIILGFTVKPNIYGAIVAKVLKIPFIANITGLGSVFINRTLTTVLVKILYRVSLSSVEHVFFQNKIDYNFFMSKHLIGEQVGSILPGSGVDTKKFSPQERSDKNHFRFLLVARVIREKGVIEYFKAAEKIKRKHKSVEFLLLGEIPLGNKRAIPINEVLEWEKRGIINYLGITDDTSKYIADVDCVVLPSYREGCPRSILEASSMGKPVIVSNVVGCNQVVENNITGIFCKERSSDDLFRKMEQMLNLSDKDRERMGVSGRNKMIEEFDEVLVIDRYLEKISQVLRKGCAN